MDTITSRQNPLIKHMRALHFDRDYRRECRAFACDGPKLFSEARSSGAQILEVLISESFSGKLDIPDGVKAAYVPEGILRAVTDVESPQGIVFSCRMPDIGLDALPEGGKIIILDGVQDPGNVGTVIRTADAFDIPGVILTGPCADPFNPKCVRATMGAIFRQRVFELSMKEAVKMLPGRELYAAENDPGAYDLGHTDLKNAYVVIGSEGSGISEEIKSICSRKLRIPIRSESLNAAVAASVIMWEMHKDTVV